MPIKSIYARQVYDSLGEPTVEVDLITDLGLFRVAVPSGVPNDGGAVELRDGEENNYLGRGVMKAVTNVNENLGPEVVKFRHEVFQQKEIDEFMLGLDGSENKSSLGVNAILGISMAVCKAGAAKRGLPLYRHIAELAGNQRLILPVPLFSVLQGGSLSGNKLTMQEIMIVPTGAWTFAEAMKMGTEVYQWVMEGVAAKYGKDGTAVGIEGGFNANIANNKDALVLVKTAIDKAGYTGRVEMAFKSAATDFFKDGKYDIDFKNPKSDKGKWLVPLKMGELYESFLKEFPIVSIEDPFSENDLDTWVIFKDKNPIQVVGDALTASNPKKIQAALEKNCANCISLKLNQIGTITEAIKVHQLALSNAWGTLISDRFGDTDDTFIADLAVGLAVGQIKVGAPCRFEHLAKYNQLLRIEEELGSTASYPGRAFRRPQ